MTSSASVAIVARCGASQEMEMDSTTAQQAEPFSVEAFHLKQYDQLREMLLSDIRSERTLEVYLIGALAVFYSWLLSQTNLPRTMLSFAAAIPVLVSVIGFVRIRAFQSGGKTVALYLRRIEAALLKESTEGGLPEGWESFLAKDAGYTKRYFWSENVFWLTIVVLTILGYVFLLIPR
jgi:hypothetical protein